MIEKQDRNGFFLTFIGLIFITTLPYFLAYYAQGNEWVFSGFFIGVDDGNSYIAKMLSGMYGSWLFKTPYTTTPQKGVFAFLPYLLIGKLANPPASHIQLIMLYQVFRLAGIFVYLLGAYNFLRIYLKSTKYRMFGLILLSIGGGLGWVLVIFGKVSIFGSIPLDFYSPEAFGFLSLFALPHLAIARGLMFAALTAYMATTNQNHIVIRYQKILPGVILFISGIFQPLSSAIGLLIISIFSVSLVLSRKNIKNTFNSEAIKLLYTAIPVIPIISYYIFVQFLDPFYKAWTRQNIITSPHPIHYLFAYIVPIAVIIIFYKTIRSQLNDPNIIFLVLWIPIFLLLPYIPYNLQRRLPDGIYFALIVFMLFVLEKNRWKYEVLVNAFLGMILIISTILIIINGIIAGKNHYEPVFIPREKAESYQQINSSIEPHSNVLSNFQTGNELPAWSPVYVAMGHGPESIFLSKVKVDAEEFYDPQGLDAPKISILKKYNIDYVLYEKEVELVPRTDGALPCYLEDMLDTNYYFLYKVVNCEE